MGKPLGMGSVKIDSTLHLTDRHSRYKTLFFGNNWYLGDDKIETKRVQTQALQAFESLIVNDPVLNPEQVASLAEVPRIKTLLALLSWPGPDSSKSDYMDLGEFRHRKVLPGPLRVLQGTGDQTEQEPCSPTKSPQPRASKPNRPEGLKPGQRVRATVTGQWQKGGVAVSLEGGLKGKLKVSRENAPKQGAEISVTVRGKSGAYFVVEMS